MFNRISHIGVVVNDITAAEQLWCGTYGLKKYAEYSTQVEGIKACLLSVSGKPGEMSIELMEPIDKSDMNNPVARRLAKSGEGFYHLAVGVDNVEATGHDLSQQGLTVIQRPPLSDKVDGRWLVHPKSSNGILVEGI